MSRVSLYLACCLSTCLSLPLFASTLSTTAHQATTTTHETEASVSETETQQILDELLRVVAADSIDAEKGTAVVEAIRSRRADGRYAASRSPGELATLLASDLVEISGDLHFNVSLDPEWVTAEQADDPEVKERFQIEEHARARQSNYGFHEIKRLEGNVGYMNFVYFHDPENAHKTVSAVMELLSRSDAVILDLRFNNGGYGEMVQLLSSYFLRASPSQVLLDTSDLNEGQRLERKFWVLPSVSGDRMPDTPLYLLTSNATFSAAEWFAFVLKNLERATVIGEQTAGGAHPVNPRALNHRFVLQMPTGMIRDGVLGEDFEGRGVTPHVAVTSAEALHVAHRAALETLIQTKPENRADYEWFLTVVDARRRPVPITPALLESLPGPYDGSRQVLREGDTLFYSWDGEGRVRLLPLESNLLALEGVDHFRFKVRSENGVVTGLERIYLDGRSRLHPKSP